VRQIVSLSGGSPIVHFVDCCEIIGRTIPPEPVNWHYFVNSIFSSDLLLAFHFMQARPDTATMGHWAEATETEFQTVFERLLRWSAAGMSRLEQFLLQGTFAFAACAAVLRNDLRFREVAAQVLAAPGHMRGAFLAQFPGAKLGGFTKLLLFVVKKVQLEAFSRCSLGPVVVRAGIAQLAHGRQVDRDLIALADGQYPVFEKLGAFPVRLKASEMTTSHIDAYSHVLEFALARKSDLRQAVMKVVARH
jgi:hypothetical protein